MIKKLKNLFNYINKFFMIITVKADFNIADKLQEHFEPLKIISFSNCCRIGCTGNYGESDFELRENGIFFIKIYLEGMNFRQNITECYADYENFNYLIENWQQEKNILEDWCRIIGLDVNKCEIIQPESENKAIEIKFNQTLQLPQEEEF